MSIMSMQVLIMKELETITIITVLLSFNFVCRKPMQGRPIDNVEVSPSTRSLCRDFLLKM